MSKEKWGYAPPKNWDFYCKFSSKIHSKISSSNGVALKWNSPYDVVLCNTPEIYSLTNFVFTSLYGIVMNTNNPPWGKRAYGLMTWRGTQWKSRYVLYILLASSILITWNTVQSILPNQCMQDEAKRETLQSDQATWKRWYLWLF